MSFLFVYYYILDQIVHHLGGLVCRLRLRRVGNGSGASGQARRMQLPHRPRHHAPGVRLPHGRKFSTGRHGRNGAVRSRPISDAGRGRRPSPSRPPVRKSGQKGDRAALHPTHPQRVLSKRRLPTFIQILSLNRPAAPERFFITSNGIVYHHRWIRRSLRSNWKPLSSQHSTRNKSKPSKRKKMLLWYPKNNDVKLVKLDVIFSFLFCCAEKTTGRRHSSSGEQQSSKR